MMAWTNTFVVVSRSGGRFRCEWAGSLLRAAVAAKSRLERGCLGVVVIDTTERRVMHAKLSGRGVQLT